MGSFLYDGRLPGMLLGGLGGSLSTFFCIFAAPWATFSGLGGSLGERWDRFWILGGFWGSPEPPERPLGLPKVPQRVPREAPGRSFLWYAHENCVFTKSVMLIVWKLRFL